MKTLTTAVLIAALGYAECKAPELPPEQPPNQDTWVAVCLVAAAGLAVGAIYLVAKRCKPRYYWLLSENGDIWLGTCTKKEAQINGWEKIGGPYPTIQDAPVEHPNITNRVHDVIAEPLMLYTVERTTDLTHWQVVNSQTNTIEEFVYYPTNTGLFRIGERAP